MFEKEKKCPYCDPYPYDIQAHFLGKLEKIIFPIQYFFNAVEAFFKKNLFGLFIISTGLLIKGFFRAMAVAGILREVDVSENDEQLRSRTAVIASAARKRNMKIKALKVFGKFSTNFFSIIVKGKKRIFEGLPLLEIGYIPLFDFDDKFALEKMLHDNNMPNANGQAFHNLKPALLYAKKFGFPLVVKPRCGSLSKHITCNIQNERALTEAIRVVQMISREFILEKFIPGNVYRITVVGNDFIACCLREPPNVIGDGIHNIKELVEIKNKEPLRGDMNQKNFTLHKVVLSEKAISLLESQDLNIKSIPPKNKKVYLHDKVVLACGTDIHDKTDDVHKDNRRLFLKLSGLLKAPLVGIDFICKDISMPYYKQNCAIIEANSLPYIDMHHFPASGTPRDVAGYIIDSML